MRELFEDSNKWKGITMLEVSELVIVKIAVIPKLIYSFHRILVKILGMLFTETGNLFRNARGNNSQHKLVNEEKMWKVNTC